MKNKHNNKTRAARKASLFLLATSCLSAPHFAFAQDINPANAATQVYKAGNGVTVVDIAKANGAGLSHNKFNDYNVDPKGVVLNNGNYEELARQSKLAGAVGANMNLDREATVILNEVVTNRTSLLQGYTEVLGGRADVIVANPNGITCDGCGFINTPNVTLTTGAPVIGGNGALSGFAVDGGTITINGTGLDGREPDYLALVSRSVELDAQINAKTLDIVTGVNDFDYITKQATARAAATAAPLYAIDSSQLGGMYANRIRLVATEDGVGVRMLGDAAAGVGDFTLNAAGKIELSNAISAKQDLNIATTESGSDAIKTTNAKLSAESDLKLAAQNGEVHLTGGTITAGNDLAVDSASLKDEKTAAVGTDNNKRYAAGDASLTQTGALAIKGTSWGADGELKADANSVTLDTNGSAYGDTVDIDATTVTIADGSTLTSEGNMALDTDTLNMAASGSQLVAARSGTGKGTLNITNGFTHSGGIFSGKDLELNTSNLTLEFTGGIGANGTLEINANGSSITNRGSLFGADKLKVAAVTTILNDSTGTMNATRDLELTAATVTNHNNIIAGRNLTVTAATIKNEIAGGDKRAWGSNVWKKYSNNNNKDGSSPYNVNEEGIGGGYDETHYYEQEWTREQYYIGGTPIDADRPQLVAGSTAGTLTLTGFNTAINLGGIMSGYNVALVGNGGSTFTNDSYDLKKEEYRRTWNNWCDRGTAPTIWSSCSWTNNRSDTTSRTASSSVHSTGAAVYAHNLTGNNFSLVNNSSPFSGASATPYSLTITLPTNPNGYFIPSQNPNSNYLIETNPKYMVGSAFLGSDFMAKLLGMDVEQLQKRLGDANYEASLIREQLLLSGAAGLLNSGDEAESMQSLMVSGANQASTLGLEYGKEPTGEQLASLKGDMVWMVEKEVNGQKVLAPVVYLSEATKSQITSGAILTASNMQLDVDSVTNTGGTINADNMAIASQGNITNTSGTISGGNIQLASRDGSIINETYASTTGGAGNMATDIGKTGGIAATGDLSLDAAKNIENRGANMSAGGDASLKAGNDIVFDTIEDKRSTERHGTVAGANSSYESESSTTQVKSGLKVGGNLSTDSGNDTTFAGTDVDVAGDAKIKAGGDVNIINRQDSRTTTSSSDSGNVFNGYSQSNTDTKSTNVGSNFNVGGNLDSTSGGDTVIQGSNVKVGGDGSVVAGGDLKILDGQNTTSSSSTSSNTGVGVGGGVYGTNSVTDTNEKGESVASNVSFGGNAKLGAGKTLTVQGSNVESGGDMDIAAQDVKILEGRNYEKSERTESTTTFLSVRDSESSLDNKSDSASSATAKGQGADASASAGASSDRNASGGVSIMETNTTSTEKFKSTGSASSLKSGGNMNIAAENDVTVRGSNVEAGGDLGVDAKNVNILASQDIETSRTTSTNVGIGFYGSSENHAGASADASAGASAGEGTAKAGVEANANASATTANTLNYMEANIDTSESLDVTHQASSLKSGGNMKLNASDQMKVVGSNIEAGGDLDMKAKDITIAAAQDVHVTKKTSDSTAVGQFADAGTEANANVNAGAQGLGASAGASADAGADAGVGYQVTNTTTSNTEGSTKVQVSTIKSGGNMTRAAENKISDEGTQIEAGGNFTQDAKEWDSKAAKDTTFSSSSSETNTGRFGLYAEANAGADYSASTTGDSSNEAGAGAGAGVKATYDRETNDESASSSKAVVSNIKVGGNSDIKTEGKTSLEGTNIDTAGDMNLETGSLDYKAAKDTETSSSDKTNANAEVKVGVDVKKKVNVELAAGYGENSVDESSSTAVVGNMASGGNMNIKVKDDATFEGTNLNAGGDASIATGGDLNFEAARDTATKTEDGMSVDASLSLSKSKGKAGSGGKGAKGMGLNASGDYETSTETSNEAVAGSITSGGKMNVSSGKNATFEGTNLTSGGDMSVEAKNDVNFKAAESTYTEDGMAVGASLSMSKGGQDKKGKTNASSAGVGVTGSYTDKSSTTQEGSSLNSGGKVNIKSGNDTNLQGTNITSTGTTTLDAGRDVNFTAAEDKVDDLSVGGGLNASKTKAAKGGDKAQNGTEGGLNFSIDGEKSTTKKAGSINAGGIEIKSGNDTTLEGTKLKSSAGTSIDAGGDVNLKAAKSDKIAGAFGGNANSGGLGAVDTAAIEGGVNYDGVRMESDGDVSIKSGGKTRMEGTVINTKQDAVIDAKGGVEKSTTVSGGAALGFDRAGVDLNVQETQINTQGKAETSFSDKVKGQVGDAFNSAANSVTDAAKSGVEEVKKVGTKTEEKAESLKTALVEEKSSLGEKLSEPMQKQVKVVENLKKELGSLEEQKKTLAAAGKTKELEALNLKIDSLKADLLKSEKAVQELKSKEQPAPMKQSWLGKAKTWFKVA